MQERSLPWDVVGAPSLLRPSNLLEKFVVELRTNAWGDTASDVEMPGSQMSGGWKCVLVNYRNMCLLLVTAKESRLLNTGPAGPLL